jgi:hypothetical protein
MTAAGEPPQAFPRTVMRPTAYPVASESFRKRAVLAALAAAVLSERDARRSRRSWSARNLLAAAALLVALTGHFGGLMAHGRDFFEW